MASVLILDRTNKQGFRKIDVLKKDKGVYFYNNFSLGKKLPPEVLQAWKIFEKGPLKDSNLICSAGTYSFIKDENQKKIKHTGCTQGEFYALWVKNVELVRRYAKERP